MRHIVDLNELPEDPTGQFQSDAADSHWEGSLYLHTPQKNRFIVSVKSTTELSIPVPPRLLIQLRHVPEVAPGWRDIPCFELMLASVSQRDDEEWMKFLQHMSATGKVARILVPGWELIMTPSEARMANQNAVYGVRALLSPQQMRAKVHFRASSLPAPELDMSGQVVVAPAAPLPRAVSTNVGMLDSLQQNHSGWAFGGLAELIDNAYDAKATKLRINIEEGELPDGKVMPMLVVTDNGHGMNRANIERMLSFGHKGDTEQEDEDSSSSSSRIGRYGVGFKTGALRLGKDAVVFTRGTQSLSIGLLSRSFLATRGSLEFPIVTYKQQRLGGRLNVSTEANSEAEAKYVLDILEKFTPFNRERIGTEFAEFGESTGTKIFIYNLRTLSLGGTELEWRSKEQCKPGQLPDIMIRGERIRRREGQKGSTVPLDWSLREYVSVLFFFPRMEVRILGTKVKTRVPTSNLSNSEVKKGVVKGVAVSVSLGYDQKEQECGNAGIHLYWRGRLIEAYKRVGQQKYGATVVGLGVIGVIELERSMGPEIVLNNKQGFDIDSEVYVAIENWLSDQVNAYLDKKDSIIQVSDDQEHLQADTDWVQCENCRKWRVLPRGYNKANLPHEWFCHMEPIRSSCDVAQESLTEPCVTVNVDRTMLAISPLSKPQGTGSRLVSSGREGGSSSHGQGQKRPLADILAACDGASGSKAPQQPSTSNQRKTAPTAVPRLLKKPKPEP